MFSVARDLGASHASPLSWLESVLSHYDDNCVQSVLQDLGTSGQAGPDGGSGSPQTAAGSVGLFFWAL